MITDLKPYPEYKEPGLLWLERYPKDWSLQRTMMEEISEDILALEQDTEGLLAEIIGRARV